MGMVAANQYAIGEDNSNCLEVLHPMVNIGCHMLLSSPSAGLRQMSDCRFTMDSLASERINKCRACRQTGANTLCTNTSRLLT